MTDLDELYAELEEFAQPENNGGHSALEERIIAGFEEIEDFVEQHGRIPQHGEHRDIFERLYAVRLERLRALEECRNILTPLDHLGLLSGAEIAHSAPGETINDDDLLAELEDVVNPSGITELRHVRSTAEVRTAEEIAQRDKCEDFRRFQPLFRQAENDLKSGIRHAVPFGVGSGAHVRVSVGDFFILGGQMVYVAEVGDLIKTPNGDSDARLRVIYANGTESNLLLRSLQRALYKDEAGRRLTEPGIGPLFSETWDEGDIESGTIYVLRSLSSDSFVAEHRELIHKIGVTGGKVETRIANAANEATYLLAEVEIVASYKLSNINRTKLENLIHRIFAPAQLDLTIQDRFGHPVKPKEWFLVPIHAIDEAVQRIRDGSITDLVYDPKTARLVGRG